MKNNEWIKEHMLERFLEYVRVYTTSDPHSSKIPTTENQWDLLNILKDELSELGITRISLDSNGYLIAVVDSNLPEGEKAPVIGLMAHVDTSPDITGKDVKPAIIENYNLEDIPLSGEYYLRTADYPDLLEHRGDTIITSDGTTLLGADDKAGIAEIMTALEWFRDNPEVRHGELEIIFTPDEETGKGLDQFDPKWLKSRCCYTVDGGKLGHIETECFNASAFEVTFRGRVTHPGSARGVLINAVSMAGTFLGLIPANESPEATDGRYGYYSPMEISGNLDEVKLSGILRDFDGAELDRRIAALDSYAGAVEAKFPGSKVEIATKMQYRNMYEAISRDMKVVEILEKAVADAGVEPVRDIIRGGTDGSKLTAMGIPTPNIFTGGHNFHSRFEWASVSSMVKSVETLINLIKLWSNETA